MKKNMRKLQDLIIVLMLCVSSISLRAVDVGELEVAARKALGGEADVATERATLKEIPQPHMEQPLAPKMEQPHIAPKVEALHPKLTPELGAAQKPMETSEAIGRWEYVEDEEAGESAGGTVANIDEYNTLAAENTKLKIAARKAEDALAQAQQVENEAVEKLDEARATATHIEEAQQEYAQAQQAFSKAQTEAEEFQVKIAKNAQARANLQKKLIEEQEAAAARGEKLTPKPEGVTEPRAKVARPRKFLTAKTLAREVTPEEIELEVKYASLTKAQNNLKQAKLEEEKAVELFSNSQVFKQGSPQWKEARDIYLEKNNAVMDAQRELHKATTELEQAKSLAAKKAAAQEELALRTASKNANKAVVDAQNKVAKLKTTVIELNEKRLAINNNPALRGMSDKAQAEIRTGALKKVIAAQEQVVAAAKELRDAQQAARQASDKLMAK